MWILRKEASIFIFRTKDTKLNTKLKWDSNNKNMSIILSKFSFVCSRSVQTRCFKLSAITFPLARYPQMTSLSLSHHRQFHF